MKQRVSSLDLKILIAELKKSIHNYRLQNIYNLVANNRSFLLKFSIPDSKVNVVLESGFKVYMTDFQRPTQPEPSNFTSKLRKHLKTKRVTDIKQVGDDRIVVFEFGDGLYYLVLEFFSAGNVILLDENLKIMTIYRFVDTDSNSIKGNYDVGSIYNMFDKSLFEDSCVALHDELYDEDTLLKWIEDTNQTEREPKKVLSIEKLCFQNAAYLSSDLIHISLLANSVPPKTSCLKLLEDDQLLKFTSKSMKDSKAKYDQLIETPVGEVEGYILSRKNELFDTEKDASADNLEYVYHEFHPYEPSHKINDNVKIECFKGYNKTVDKFFTAIEMSKVSLGRQQQKANISKRLQYVKDEHSKKLQVLDEVQALNNKKGTLITYYNEKIEECKRAVQELIDQKMDWKNIEKYIKVQKDRGNETAKMIKSLNLIKNEITISLVDNEDEYDGDEDDMEESGWSTDDSDSDSDSDSESKSDSVNGSSKIQATNVVDVVIDITLSAFANASRYFDAKKTAKDKQEKTAKNAALAIRSSEQKIQNDLKRMEKESKQNVEFKQLRPKFWFEKFFWFISSEGYLCVAGRDDNQVDSIYYKYFDNETDCLVSNDLENCLKVFIKNPYKNKDIPPTTYMQAGIFSLSTTKAWDNKMVTSPWYVPGKGVSKKDFDGTILPTGLLNVNKERNYLPPCQMVMGAGLLFLADKETFTRYREGKKQRDGELELISGSKSKGSTSKILELKTMLAKLQDAEKSDTGESVNEIETENDEQKSSENDEVIMAPLPAQQTQTTIRGKKNKLKKIKEKYGHQDDEERRLRMAVLGTLKQVEDKQKFEDKKSNEDPRMSIAAKKRRKRQQQINQIIKLIDELENKGDETDVGESDEYMNLVNDVDNYHLNISGLLGAPKKTDVVSDCIPVFAPWSALNKYTYKVKLQPGNLKKGKTVKDIVETFKRRTGELIKDESDWYDRDNKIELINEQEFMMALTASKFKIGSSGSSSGKNDSRGGNNRSKGGKAKSKKK